MIDEPTAAKIRAGRLAGLIWKNDAGNDVVLLFPTVWDSMVRVNAINALENFGKFLLNRLAEISLIVTDGDPVIAAKLLRAGWSPHEEYMLPESYVPYGDPDPK